MAHLFPHGDYTLTDFSLGTTKLATKKLGFPLSPTAHGPTLPAPLNSEEAVEGTSETARLLPVQGEA